MRKFRNRLLLAAVSSATVVGALLAINTPAAHAATCTASLGNGCGPYQYAGIPMSNGYDTYVSNQSVGANSGTTQTVTATDPGNWSVTANDGPYGYTGVQTFPDVQQLTNDWCSSGGWAKDGTCNADTPLSALSSLKVNYSESSPRDTNSIYEFAPDVWSNYPSDVMFWADTFGRCNTGAFGGTLLGRAAIDGQNWTVHRYGGTGAEIIFVLDGAGGSGTCAQQTSGTINIKAGFDWLAAHGILSNPVLSQLNTGWEITSADNTTFRMASYSIAATLNGTPSPSPTSTSTTPASTPTSSSPDPTPTSSTPASSSSTVPADAPLVGDNTVETVQDNNPQGTAEAFQYVARDSGTTTTVHFYVDSSSTATAGRLGIYNDGTHGNPYQLLGQVAFTPAPGWNTASLNGVGITAGRRYWLVELGTIGSLAYRDQSTDGSVYSETKTVGSTLPTAWAAGGGRWNSGNASFYVSGSSAAPSPTTTSSPPPTLTTSVAPTATTTAATPTPTSTAPAGQVCTNPYFTTSGPNGGVSDGGFYVHNNLWNASNYPGTKGTTAVCSYHSWNHYGAAGNTSGDGAVKTYPNVHKDYSPAHSLSSFPRLTSSEAVTSPGTGVYDVAYDLWVNGIATSSSNEVMIWTENHNQRPAGNVVASGLSFSGYKWDLWSANNNHYLAFAAPAATSGTHPGWPTNEVRSPATLDVKAMLSYLVSSGRLASTSVLNQLCFGVEIVDTGGVQRAWNVTDFSLADS